MSPASRALSLHGVCLLLSAPLLFFWFRSPDGTIAGPQVWGLFAVATIYALTAIMARPTSIYDGGQKVGVPPRGLRLALLAVAFVVISAPLLDNESQIAPILGLCTLIASAICYLLALRNVLCVKE